MSVGKAPLHSAPASPSIATPSPCLAALRRLLVAVQFRFRCADWHILAAGISRIQNLNSARGNKTTIGTPSTKNNTEPTNPNALRRHVKDKTQLPTRRQREENNETTKTVYIRGPTTASRQVAT